jgi:hypothetical protein
VKPFVWLGPEQCDELRRQLNAGPVLRLEIHGKGKDTTLHVIPGGPVPLEGGGEINKSNVCPPICP